MTPGSAWLRRGAAGCGLAASASSRNGGNTVVSYRDCKSRGLRTVRNLISWIAVKGSLLIKGLPTPPGSAFRRPNGASATPPPSCLPAHLLPTLRARHASSTPRHHGWASSLSRPAASPFRCSVQHQVRDAAHLRTRPAPSAHLPPSPHPHPRRSSLMQCSAAVATDTRTARYVMAQRAWERSRLWKGAAGGWSGRGGL